MRNRVQISPVAMTSPTEAGKWLIERVSQRVFEWMVIGFALLAAVKLMLG